MKILIIDTYYEKFLKTFYKKNRYLKNCEYDFQLNALLNSNFGTSDAYSYYFNKNNWEAKDLIVNCLLLQKEWGKKKYIKISDFRSRIPYKFFKLPIIGKKLGNINGLLNIAKEQIKAFKPEILYCQDLSFFPEEILLEIKKENNIRLIVGQIACPLPPKYFLNPYDLILTSFPHFVNRLRNDGKNCEYFKIGFDKRILSKIPPNDRDIDFSFVGGISKYHNYASKNIEYLIKNAKLQVYGYGVNKLPFNSNIRRNHKGERWGLDMYSVLSRSKISFNRHINVAENNANNMRLYEATGMGSLLLTDRKDNLRQLFEEDHEIVTYESKEEALDKYNYLINKPEELAKIAKAGQLRTLKEHTYETRIKELIQIITKYLKVES